jgi:hypothetical protein
MPHYNVKEELIMEQLLSLDFGAYVALAFILYVIRESGKVPNSLIPVVGLFLGLVFALFEYMHFDFDVMLEGIKYAMLGVGTVAGIKYAQEKRDK